MGRGQAATEDRIHVRETAPSFRPNKHVYSTCCSTPIVLFSTCSVCFGGVVHLLPNSTEPSRSFLYSTRSRVSWCRRSRFLPSSPLLVLVPFLVIQLTASSQRLSVTLYLLSPSPLLVLSDTQTLTIFRRQKKRNHFKLCTPLFLHYNVWTQWPLVSGYKQKERGKLLFW